MKRSVFVLTMVLCAVLRSDTLVVEPVQLTTISKRLEAGVLPRDKRETGIRELFVEAGCEPAAQKVNKRTSNVICTLPGESASTIVVGAHFDFVRAGQGIVDDWSGTSLLPSLYEALKGKVRKHTFVFVAFAAEEEGLIGSRRFVKELTKEQRSEVRAFVNLECLGLTPLKIWVTRSTPSLVTLFAQVANAIGMPPSGVSLDAVGDDDTHSFKDVKIPVISLHSISQEKFKILHSKADNVAAVLPEELYSSYRTIAFYLAHLDAKLP
jgi:Zn-dependent M28 family amino/carboxypeptidase